MPNALERLKISQFEEGIFEMSFDELRQYFSFGTGALNTSMLIKNLIWQDHRKILAGEIESIFGNVRSYWYARLKPVLSRAEAPNYADKYHMMGGLLAALVVRERLLCYADFGFVDDNRHNRALGVDNSHIIVVAEKTGHMPLLEQLNRDYEVTVVALGGQPSALASEYLLRDLLESGFAPTEPTPLFTIVDYDPTGDSIVRSFIWQLQALGFPGEFTRVDLAHPSRMSSDQIRLNKYRLSQRKSERKKNRQWAGRTRGLQSYGHGVFYGIEADAMTWSQLLAAFDSEVTGYLKVPRTAIVRRRLDNELVDVLMKILFSRLFG